MKHFYKLLIVTLICFILTSCGGGGGKAACTLAVGGLACLGSSSGSSSGSSGSSSSSVTSTYTTYKSMNAESTGATGPQSGLVEVNGIFYGTTESGGSANLGTVFSINSSLQITVIHSFTGSPDGANPFASLVVARDGNLWGTTVNGGSNNYGTVFKVSLSSGTPTYSQVHVFLSTNGANPYGGLIQGTGTDTALYGTTSAGGDSNLGTVYKITLLGQESVIHSFSGSDGSNPQSTLIKDSNGMMYGTTKTGGGASDTGTVFSVSTSGVENVIHPFDADTHAINPESSLLLASDGQLYGTTSTGGQYGLGTIYSLSTSGLNYQVLHEFAGATSDGSNPYGNLVEINSVIYGTTQLGGSNDLGLIYSYKPTTGVVSPVYSFGLLSDGAQPFAGLMLGSDGYYYGTTTLGGANSKGTVYKFYP